jgi:ELP3 family radical SAM enzyme/protein acetyltransferase
MEVYLDILRQLVDIIRVLKDNTPLRQIKKQLLMRYNYLGRKIGSKGMPLKKAILLFVYRTGDTPVYPHNKAGDTPVEASSKTLGTERSDPHNKVGDTPSLLRGYAGVSPAEEEILLSFLQKAPSRNISGVTVVTVLTAPFPDGQKFSCKHDCYYCPAEPNQPRSYLMSEPAVARANRNEFDARRQTLDRLNTLHMNGHEIDKIEFILEGGTFTEYPADYLERFIRDLVYSVNTYFDTVRGVELREPMSVVEELRVNRTAKVRISGICIETRPDVLLYPPLVKNGENGETIEQGGDWWIKMFRRWGVTRVQLGVQHTVDHILDGVNRGHDADTASRAIEHLKNQCFKVDIHLMPDLPGASPEMDKQMFEDVYHGTHFQADQIKVYPCQVVPWTRIEKWYRDGKYVPYAETDWEAFAEVVRYAMVECPPWIRLPRVMRDIPSKYIRGGKCVPNLRQVVTNAIAERGEKVREIRSRECARHDDSIAELREGREMFMVRQYDTRNGREMFLSFETEDEKALFGFCRLRLPGMVGQPDLEAKLVFGELRGLALIRELHVYGNVVRVGGGKQSSGVDGVSPSPHLCSGVDGVSPSPHLCSGVDGVSPSPHLCSGVDGVSPSQHRGIGTRLLKKAEWIAWKAGYRGLAVISGCGVEEYYEKRGYKRVGAFMTKRFRVRPIDIMAMVSILMVYVLLVCLVVM